MEWHVLEVCDRASENCAIILGDVASSAVSQAHDTSRLGCPAVADVHPHAASAAHAAHASSAVGVRVTGAAVTEGGDSYQKRLYRMPTERRVQKYTACYSCCPTRHIMQYEPLL